MADTAHVEPARLMAGKRGLIMGVANDHSIAWGIARTLAAHGAELAFTYQGDAQAKRVTPLAESVGSKLVLPCDVENDAELDAVFATLAERMGQPRLPGPFARLFRPQRAEGPLRRHQPRRTSSARSTSPAIPSPTSRAAPPP